MNGIKAVLFDLDDTLIDRDAAFIKYCNRFIDFHFTDIPLPDTRENMTSLMVLLDEDGYGSNRDKMFNELIEKWNLTDCTAQQFEKNRRDTFADFIGVNEKTNEFLKNLKAKYKLGIITNGSAKLQHGKIDNAGFRDLFDVILVSDEVGVAKPDKAIFDLACEKLNIKANDAVFVGDYFKNDIIGAANAGLMPIWLNYKKAQCDSDIEYKEIFELYQLDNLLLNLAI